MCEHCILGHKIHSETAKALNFIEENYDNLDARLRSVVKTIFLKKLLLFPLQHIVINVTLFDIRCSHFSPQPTAEVEEDALAIYLLSCFARSHYHQSIIDIGPAIMK